MSRHGERALSRARLTQARFVDSLPRAREEQEQFLRDRVRENETTAFGIEHDFARIAGVDDFRRAVPIRGYDALSPWIERAAAGEPAVLTAQAPVAFLRTSGTTGRSKTIPHTPLQGTLETFAQWLGWAALLEAHPVLVSRDDTAINLGFDPIEREAGKVPAGASSQMIFGQGRDPMEGFPGYSAPWSRPPSELEAFEDRVYFRLRLAIERDLVAIASINPSSIVVLCQLLARSWPRLVREVADGTLMEKAWAEPDPGRARALERLPDPITPRQIWPNLRVLRCWTSASAAHYLPDLRARFGADVDIWPYLTIATEGAVAVPLACSGRRPVLLVSAGFFEFVPVSETVRADSPTLLVDELEAGRDYHLIQTRANGLYRYDLGDTYRVLDFVDRTPCLEYIGRQGGFSSFTGEKLTEWQVVAATAAGLRECGLVATNYVWFPRWADPPYYLCVMEPSRRWSGSEIQQLGLALDRQLAAHNDEYPSKRASGRLGPVVVEPIEVGAFRRYWDHRVAQGAAPSQVKDTPLQPDDAVLELLRRHGRGGEGGR